MFINGWMEHPLPSNTFPSGFLYKWLIEKNQRDLEKSHSASNIMLVMQQCVPFLICRYKLDSPHKGPAMPKTSYAMTSCAMAACSDIGCHLGVEGKVRGDTNNNTYFTTHTINDKFCVTKLHAKVILLWSGCFQLSAQDAILGKK